MNTLKLYFGYVEIVSALTMISAAFTALVALLKDKGVSRQGAS